MNGPWSPRRCLEANGGTLQPAALYLENVLMIFVENAGEDEALVRVAQGWPVNPKAPHLYRQPQGGRQSRAACNAVVLSS